jgi:hypothetical protein
VSIGSLGRSKSGKHRSPAVDANHQHDDELSSYLAALAPDNSPTSVELTGGLNTSQIYQLRLQLIANEQLKELAAERNVSPQRLATEWVLERLALEFGNRAE